MILVALAVVVLGTYVPLMLTAARGRRWAGVVGAVEGFMFVCGAGFASLVGWVFLWMRCDDTCDQDPPPGQSGDWWRLWDSPEWKVQAALIFTTLFITVLTAALPASRRYRAAIVAVILSLATFCAWALLVAPLGEQFGI